GIRDFHVTGVQTCALPISPELRLALTVVQRLRIERDGLTPRLKPGSAPKNFDQRTLLCGESTLPTPHHPLQRLPSHPLMPQPRRRLPTQLSQNSYRLTNPPHPRIRLR